MSRNNLLETLQREINFSIFVDSRESIRSSVIRIYVYLFREEISFVLLVLRHLNKRSYSPPKYPPSCVYNNSNICPK